MTRDAFGLATSSSDPAATTAFSAAVRALAAHRPETGVALGNALAADPDHVAALALKGFANLILAREELRETAAGAARAAHDALAARDGGTADERCLVSALDAAVAGRFDAAALVLDEGFANRPATFLPFKIAYSLRFMRGDAAGMLQMSDRMMEDWRADAPGAGYLLGCRAFALEEHGRYAAAERAGRRAVELEPDDAWGMHAVSHVHEMRGDTADGIDWLEQCRPAWSRCNNFSFHMAWHLALLHLARGEHARVLALYDTDVRPVQTDDFRDVANAVSLLWRLSSLGVDTGSRWQELRAIAERRQADTTLVFGTLHTLLTLIALRDHAGIAALIAALEQRAASGDDQAGTACHVGLPLARFLTDRNAAGRADVEALVQALPAIGGSNAQRDVFMLAIADVAARRGDAVSVAQIAVTRGRLKNEDRLIRTIEARAGTVAALRLPARMVQGYQMPPSTRRPPSRQTVFATALPQPAFPLMAKGG